MTQINIQKNIIYPRTHYFEFDVRSVNYSCEFYSMFLKFVMNAKKTPCLKKSIF